MPECVVTARPYVQLFGKPAEVVPSIGTEQLAPIAKVPSPLALGVLIGVTHYTTAQDLVIKYWPFKCMHLLVNLFDLKYMQDNDMILKS